VATTIINITGSLLLGLITGLASQQLLPYHWQLITGTGILGGYTTFSTPASKHSDCSRTGDTRPPPSTRSAY
jgi:fluoride ion exporter CrcB/FEX